MATQGQPGPLMRRPDFGKRGSPVVIRSNAFKVNRPLPEFKVHHYDVTIRPEVPTRVNRQVFDLVDKDGGFKGVAAVYDGQKNCYTPSRLDFAGDTHVFEIVLPEDDIVGGGSSRKPQREGRNFRVAFKKVAEVQLFELAQVITKGASQSVFTENCLQAIAVLNIMLRHTPSIANISKAASIYPEPAPNVPKCNLSGGLELWRGYFSSIRPAPGQLIVNVDSTMLPLIQPGNLVPVAAAFLRCQPQQLANLADRDRIKLGRFLRGIKVIVNRNDPQTPKMRYKIKDVSRQSARTLTFKDESGKTTNVAAYFQTVLNVNLRGADFPCVQLTKTAWYPLELCTIQSGNKFTKKLDPDQISEALKFTTNPPHIRIQQVKDGLQTLGYASNPICRAWGFSIDPTPIEFAARVLPPPSLHCQDRNGKPTKIQANRGTFDLRNKKFFQSGSPKVKSWACILFAGPRDRFTEAEAEPALKMLAASCAELGCPLPGRPVISRGSPVLNQTTKSVREDFLNLLKKCNNVPPQLVVCLLPAKNELYGPVKQFAELGPGIATQCLNIGKINRTLSKAYFDNVALKINIKLGGVNVKLDPNDLPGFAQTPTIVFGADVTHPGPASVAPSVAAVVGSWDQSASNYAAKTSIQSSREEMSPRPRPSAGEGGS